jgi:trimeric autotransporter adhesin
MNDIEIVSIAAAMLTHQYYTTRGPYQEPRHRQENYMSNNHSVLWKRAVLRAFFAVIAVCALGFIATASAVAQEVVAIAAGGPAQSNSGGGDYSFVADEDFVGGGDNGAITATINLTQPGTNAAPMGVYQNGRAGVFTYTIPGLTAGSSYTVLLHFAETYFTTAGSREFNVAINGTTVLTNFDIVGTVGAKDAALLKTFTATANSSGDIVIAFTAGAVNQPLLMGLEIRGTSAPTCSAVPSAPTGLAATATSSSVIGLTWTAVTPPANCTISSYSVYRSTTSGFTPGTGTLVASGLTAPSYSNTGLAASTTYYFIVEALDSDGTSVASAQATAETEPTACSTVPSAPTGLAATTTSSSAIGLSWTAVTPPANCSISSYSVYGGTTTNPTTLIASGLTGTTYSNTGLAASTTYYYVVKAIDADGTSAASTQANATTSPTSPSTDIVSINAGGAAASNSGGGDNSFVADEDYSAGGTTYSVTNTITIPAGIAATAAPAAVYQTARQGTVTYTIPGLTAGASYTVRLHFAELYFTAAGSREFNVAINGTTVLTNFDIYATAGARYTAVVENYTATANSSGDIVIAFTNGTIDQPMFEGIEVLGSAASSCTTDPSAPTGLTATASSSSVIGLKWTAVTAPANCTISSYSVYGSTTSGFTPGTSNQLASGVAGTTYSNTGLAASTNYYYVVEAVDAEGNSVASTQATAETGTTTCGAVSVAPTGLTATATSSSAISLSWTAVTPPTNCTISSYSVYGSTTSGFTPGAGNLVTSGLTGTTYSATGLTASTAYYYVVEAVDAEGNSAASAQATATTQAPANNTGYVSINSGGPAVSNATGGDNSFVADEDLSAGGTTFSVANAITIPASIAATAAPAAVYQTAGQGVVTYTIPNLTAGTSYIVRLHFAELYFTAAGNREFDVAINGTTVLTNFDIYATAGAADTAVVEQFTEPANSSGQIVIAFTDGAANQPMFNGIEVLDATPCTTLPAAPTGLTATATYPSVIALNWTAVTAPANCKIGSYDVYGGTAANPTTLIASGLTGTTFTNTGLTASTAYYYVVKAVDAEGTSAASTQATATTPAPAVIAPPTSLTAVGSSYQQIDLRWVASTASAPNTAPVNYSIYRSTTTPFTPSAANLMGTTVGITNYVDNNYPATLTAGESSIPPGPGVQPSTTYYYMVVATTLSGASSAATASATSLPAAPSAAAPAALTGLTAMAENANEIDLVWNSTNSGVGTAATEYYVYRNTTQPFTPATTNLIGTTKSNWFQDALGKASTQYYYQVLANNSIGVSPSSATVTATTTALNPNLWGGAPFWDASNMPALPAGDTVMMKFLNRTNGVYADDQITWTATINGVASQYTFAQQPTFAMPPNSSGRMYFFLNDPTLDEDNTDYWDYIEFTAGPTSINMDTTRVDALGVKIAFNLTCSDGTNIALGENQEVFTEDRSVTLQRYLTAAPYNLTAAAPYDFQADETLYGPYRIIEPGGAGFNAGLPYQNYYANYISSIWSYNGITIAEAGPNGAGLGANPDLSAAIFRHTAPISGTPEFNAAGALTNEGMWGNPASFYQQEPYDHYAQWIEAQAINMQQYAFPYNDAGGYSSDIGCAGPETLLIAVGW